MPNTREKAAKWFADRAANTPMPGARAMFEIAADALQEKTVQEWISVKERLPENGKKALVYCKENKNDYEIGAYSDTYRGFFVRQTCYENITHWMPLPEPPKGE